MSLLDDVTALAVVGVVGFVGYEALKVIKGLEPGSTTGSNGQSAAFQVGSAAGTAVGDAAAGAVSGTFNGLWLGGDSICQFIQAWRQAGAPNASLFGINIPFSGGGNPNDWSAFSRWMQISNQFDPGPTPPKNCW